MNKHSRTLNSWSLIFFIDPSFSHSVMCLWEKAPSEFFCKESLSERRWVNRWVTNPQALEPRRCDAVHESNDANISTVAEMAENAKRCDFLLEFSWKRRAWALRVPCVNTEMLCQSKIEHTLLQQMCEMIEGGNKDVYVWVELVCSSLVSGPGLVNPVWALLFCTSMRSTCPSRTSFCFLFCHPPPPQLPPENIFEEIVLCFLPLVPLFTAAAAPQEEKPRILSVW